ncbi:MAG: response regulator [Armatimonadota bacterium]
MPSTTTHTILLVEDHDDVRALLHLVLTDAGYAVTTVATGAAALNAMSTTTYALVLTDYHLPDMVGATVAQTARRFNPPVKVLLMSGHPDLATYAKTMGADAWFQKGEPLILLLTLVRQLMGMVS